MQTLGTIALLLSTFLGRGEAQGRLLESNPSDVHAPSIASRGGLVEFAWLGERAGSHPIETPAEAERAARAAWTSFRELDAIPSTELVLVEARSIAGLWSIEFSQDRSGVRVREGRVDVDVATDGRVLQVRATGLCAGLARGEFVLSESAARTAACSAVDPSGDAQFHVEPARKVLAWSPRGFVRAFEVSVEEPTCANGSWVVVIDAVTGSVLDLERRATCAVSGTVNGRGLASGPSTTNLPSTSPMRNLHVVGSDSAALNSRLTANTCGDDQAVISADGSRVAYVSGCDGDAEIWTVLADGTGAVQLTFDLTRDASPVLSTDGSKVAFVSEVDGDPEIFVMNTDGTGRVQVSTNTAVDEDPSLNGSGTVVVWASYADGDAEILRSSTSTPAPVQLTFDAGRDEMPVISADGTRIAFASDRDGDREIFAMAADGTALVQLTTNASDDQQPSISGDGSLVVFQSLLQKAVGVDAGDPGAGRRLVSVVGSAAVSPDWDLFSVRTDGSALTRLTESHARETSPDLADGGATVAYVVAEEGRTDIQVMNLATGQTVAMTNTALADFAPSLSASATRGVWTVLDGDLEIESWNSAAPGAILFGTTDATGAFSLAAPDATTPSLTARLQGLFARVVDESPFIGDLRANLSVAAPSAGNVMTFQPTGADELATAQVTAYQQVDRAHGKLSTILTRAPLSLSLPLPIDRPLPARVNVGMSIANAFYNLVRKDATFFVGRGQNRPNTAYDTVIQHEYGHYFDDVFGGLGPGSTCEGAFALSEAIGDITATFTSATDIVGLDWKGPLTWLRHYGVPVSAGGSGGRQYDGRDCKVQAGKPEVHDHGEAFAGFALQLRTTLGPVLAEDLIFGALAANPPNMQAAVTETFLLASMPAYGGTGSPITSPHYDALCTAAAAHGFDCVPRADYESTGCLVPACSTLARHLTTGTEWLGTIVDFETGCETLPNNDDDGLSTPHILPVPPGFTLPVTVTVRVNPALKHTGRYGGAIGGVPIRERLVYLNAWLFVYNPSGPDPVFHVLGTGSSSTLSGPAGFAPNTVAFDPDTWAGDSTSFAFTVPIPAVDSQTYAVLRLRLDYGEDCGEVVTCLSRPDLDGPCGTARYGEVEDHQFIILNP